MRRNKRSSKKMGRRKTGKAEENGRSKREGAGVFGEKEEEEKEVMVIMKIWKKEKTIGKGRE